MFNLSAYNTAIAASASAALVFAVLAVLWYVLKDVCGAWRTIHSVEERNQLAAAAERRHAMNVARRTAKKAGAIPRIEINGTLKIVSLADFPVAPWPPVKMRPALPDDMRIALKRHVVEFADSQPAGTGICGYAPGNVILNID